MQYEVVIMDLMSRIIKLEKEVEELKKAVAAPRIVYKPEEKEPIFMNDVAFEGGPLYKREKTGEHKKMTEEMTMACYDAGEKLYEEKKRGMMNAGTVNKRVNELADEIVAKTGANRSSMVIYIYAVCSLLEGEIFKRAINSKALRMYFNIILGKYGAEGLQKAIKATRDHIDYRLAYGQTVDAIMDICDEYAQQYEK